MVCKNLWKSVLDNLQGNGGDGLKSRLMNGAFWSVAGAVGGKGMLMIAFILVARILGQYTYGEFGIIRSTINMFTVIVSLGIGYTASKFIAQYRNTRPETAGEIYLLSYYLSLGVGILGTVLLVVFSAFIAEHSLQAPALADAIKWGALVLFFTTVNGVQNGALAGFEDFKAIAVNTFIAGVLQSLCLVAGSYFGGTDGAVIGLGMGCVGLCFLNNRSLKRLLKKYQITFRGGAVKRETLKILWKFSLPSILTCVMGLPVLWWAKTYLIRHAGYVEMANFDVADQWCVLALFIPGTLAQIILPLLSNTLSEGTTGQYFKLIKINVLLNIGIAALISLGVILLGKYILGFYGSGFVEVRPLIFMMLASVVMAANNVAAQVFASQEKMWLGFLLNTLWALWIVVFTILLVGRGDGATGLAIAIGISYALHFIVQGIYIFVFLKK